MGRATRGEFQLGFRPVLDGLRGIAIPVIVVYHFAVVLWKDANDWLMTGAYTSLDLFFALSGFLITCLLIAEFDRSGRVDLPGFAVRRIRRLVPAMAAVLTVVVLAALTGFGIHRKREALEGSLWLLAFLHNGNPPHRLLTEMGQAWSLGVEAQFYVLWSVAVAVVLAAFRRGRALLAAGATVVVVAVVVARTAAFNGDQHPVLIYIATPYRIDGPLVGALAGVAYASGWLAWLKERWAGWLAGGGLAYLGFVAVWSKPFDTYQLNWAGYTVNALVSAVVVVASVTLTRGRLVRWLGSRPVVYAGTISYGLFLWHMPIFQYLAKHGGSWPIAVKAIVGFGTTFVLAALSYRFVESPFLRSRKLGQDRTASTGQAPSGDDGSANLPGGGASPTTQGTQESRRWGASNPSPRVPTA